MSEIKFKRDTSFRKQFFVPDSFAHPAKMDAQLLIWIVEHYSKAGETILDPMAGSGTMMLACTLGRDVVLVELEEKFCKMMRDNWELVKMRPQLGSVMGNCQIIQGDARQLENILCDKLITSPPYSDISMGGGLNTKPPREGHSDQSGRSSDSPSQKGLVDKIVTSPPYTNRMDGGVRGSRAGMIPYTDESPDAWFTQRDQRNIGNLPYGQIDKIVASPPYEGSDVSQTHMTSDKRGDKDNPNYRPSWKRKLAEGYAQTKRPYHEVDSIITSPPFSEVETHKDGKSQEGYEFGTKGKTLSNNDSNIGNLKSDSYLMAMLQVYQQCHKVLRLGGLMILVTKNFIRNKQVVRLDTDTIKLCEQAGFTYLERHYRRLPSQSFWRIIYHQKHPEVEQINYEDVLVFKRQAK